MSQKTIDEVMSGFEMPKLDFKTKEEKEKGIRIINKFYEFVKKNDIKGAKAYLTHMKKNELSNATR